MATLDADPGPSAVVVHFIRHGEVHNPGHIFYGRLPGFHLSETGFTEARALGVELLKSLPEVAATHGLRGTSAVLHSPMLRARETAEVLIAAQGTDSELTDILEVEADLIEVYSPLDNRPLKDVAAMNFEIYSHGREDEGFEVFPDVVRRVRRLVEKLYHSPRHKGKQVLAVCHGDICLAARLMALRGVNAIVSAGPLKNKPDWLPYPDHCSVTSLWVGAEDDLDVPRWLNVPATIRIPEEELPMCKRHKATINGGTNVEIQSSA